MQTILIIGIIQSVIFLLLNIQKSKKTIADKILLLWLCVFGTHLAFLLLFFEFNHNIRFSMVIAKTIVLLHGPILFIYANTILNEHNSIKLANHFWPFIVFSFTGLILSKEMLIPWENSLVVAKFISIFSYPIFTVYWLNKRNNYLKTENSNNIVLEIRWIKTLAYLLLISFAISVLYIVINQTLDLSLDNNLDILVYVAMITIMGYYGLKLGIVFKSNMAEEEFSIKIMKSYKHSPLNKDKILKIRIDIQSFFDGSEAYLNPDFSLSQLSKQLDIPKHHLSQVINSEMGTTFYDMVNTKRVEHVMQRIKSKTDRNVTLEALGYDAGFNTKSSFFYHFKKYTGKTPRQYKLEISPN